MKKLFSTFLVAALIVPFVFALSACGKDKKNYKEIDASIAYAAVIDYVKAKEENPVKKQTYVYTDDSSYAPKEKTIFGYDETGEPAANNYFIVRYEDDVLTFKEFTAVKQTGKESQKNIYKFENEAWVQPTEFVDAEYSNYVEEYKNEITERISLSFFDNTELSVEDFAARIKIFAETAFAGKDIKVKTEGREYEDGSIGFLYHTIISEGKKSMTIVSEYIIKDNSLVKYISSYDGNTQTIEIFENDYMGDFYANDDLEYCVPNE